MSQHLPKPQRDEVKEFISTRLQLDQQRQAAVNDAFGHLAESPDMVLGGAAGVFASNVIDTLLNYGDIEGVPALALFLRAIDTGDTYDAQVEQWIAAIDRRNRIPIGEDHIRLTVYVIATVVILIFAIPVGLGIIFPTPTPTPIVTTVTPATPTLDLPELPEAIAIPDFNGNADWIRIWEGDRASNDPQYSWVSETGIEMVLVPPGCFTIGLSTDQREILQPIFAPTSNRFLNAQMGPRPTTLTCFEKPFWIDRTEVTNGYFNQLVDRTSEGRFTGDGQPVTDVTWIEAQEFCNLRGMRLPTEAEWEYAAGGPSELFFPWSGSYDYTQRLVSYADPINGIHAIFYGEANQVTRPENVRRGSGEVARPAGASWVGAVDMSGNVFEWTTSLALLDRAGDFAGYPSEYNEDNRYPSQWNSFDHPITDLRVARGGSWVDNRPELLTTARKRLPVYLNDPNLQSGIVGFRCVYSDPEDWWF